MVWISMMVRWSGRKVAKKKKKKDLPLIEQAVEYTDRSARSWPAAAAPHPLRSHRGSGFLLATAAPSCAPPARLQGAGQTRPQGPPAGEGTVVRTYLDGFITSTERLISELTSAKWSSVEYRKGDLRQHISNSFSSSSPCYYLHLGG